MARKTEDRVSTRVGDAEQAGLPDDIDVEVIKSEYTVRSKKDYTEEVEEDDENAVPIWHLELQPEEGDAFPLYLSCGSIKRVAPTADGTGLRKVRDSVRGVSNSSKQFYMLESMVECEPALDEAINEDVSSIEGMKFHMLRKAPPKGAWAGMAEPEADEEGRSRSRMIVVCSEILELPKGIKASGGKRAKAASGKSSGKATAKGKSDEDDDKDSGDEASDEAQEIINDLLQEDDYKEDGVSVKRLYRLIAAAAKKSENKDRIIELSQDDDWLGHKDRPWVVEDGTLKNA